MSRSRHRERPSARPDRCGGVGKPWCPAPAVRPPARCDTRRADEVRPSPRPHLARSPSTAGELASRCTPAPAGCRFDASLKSSSYSVFTPAQSPQTPEGQSPLLRPAESAPKSGGTNMARIRLTVSDGCPASDGTPDQRSSRTLHAFPSGWSGIPLGATTTLSVSSDSRAGRPDDRCRSSSSSIPRQRCRQRRRSNIRGSK